MGFVFIDCDLWADIHNALCNCALLYDERGDYAAGDDVMDVLRCLESAGRYAGLLDARPSQIEQ